ncbi:MAG: radical SAM protein [Deltaproteobacteria bacterium]|nr:radical SAM protein [Deltaproteobacteria bacterium]
MEPAASPEVQPEPGLVLINPPAISKRYLKTKFLPFGMATVFAYLKARGLPVVQRDLLVDYLFHSPEDINYHDYHNPALTFTEEDYFAALNGSPAHPGLAAFGHKYAAQLPAGAGIYAFSIVAYHQFWACLLLAKQIKEANPGAKIVFGGPFITIRPVEAYVDYGQADYWVKGNGDVPLLELWRLLEGKAGQDRRDIPGLIYRHEGRLVQNPKAVTPAQEEAPPDFEGLNLDRYRFDHPLTGPQSLFLHYRVAKGCPSACSFCTGRLVDRYDRKSPEKVLRELKALAAKYQTNCFMFADASLNGDPDLLARICDRLAVELPQIKWYAYSRVRGFSDELVKKVARAGCFSLSWGVEACRQPTIDLLGKRFREERVYPLIDACVAAGIKNHVHLIYNTPHETEDDVRALIEIMDRYRRSKLVVFLPMRFLLEPQSLIYDKPQTYGLTNVRELKTELFERSEYAFDEMGGLSHEEILARNQRHYQALADRLAYVRFKGFKEGTTSVLVKLIPIRALVWLQRRAAGWPLAEKLRQRLVRFLKAKAPFKEEL